MARNNNYDKNGNYKGCRISKKLRLAIYLRDHFQCLYCGKDLHGANPQNITLDHLKPASKGGKNEAKNLICSCRHCNCSRGDKPWTRYAPGGAIRRIRNHKRRKMRRYLELAKDLLKEEPSIHNMHPQD